MGAIISYNNYDHNHEQPIAVIASFNNGGAIRPLYVRLGEQPRKVISSRIRNNDRKILEFDCIVLSDNRAVNVKITYYVDHKIWTVPDDVK